MELTKNKNKEYFDLPSPWRLCDTLPSSDWEQNNSKKKERKQCFLRNFQEMWAMEQFFLNILAMLQIPEWLWCGGQSCGFDFQSSTEKKRSNEKTFHHKETNSVFDDHYSYIWCRNDLDAGVFLTTSWI